MGNRYVLLGAGRQATAAAYDLARFGDADSVLLCDIDTQVAKANAERLNGLLERPVVRARRLDVDDAAAAASALDDATACVSSVHYTHNLAITRVAIEKKVHMTDFGGNTEIVWKQRACNSDAARAGITIVPDCGMGPGLNVSLATYAMSLVEHPREVSIWDGGLPQEPQPPWNYESTFAIGGLTNEYDGKATFLRGGRLTPVPCFSDLEEIDFGAPVGRLEAFVTSGGLSTAPWTFQGTLERLENKTLRYPGHCLQFKAFRDLGLFGLDPVSVSGTSMVPRDLYHALLSPQISREAVRDVCVMRVRCAGESRGKRISVLVDLVDRFDETTGFTAMQRLTGWHTSIMTIAAARGDIGRGVVPVELALPGATVVEECRRRGLAIEVRTSEE